MKLLSKNEFIDSIHDLHGDCNETSCTIGEAIRQDYPLLAADLLSGAGALSDAQWNTFKSLKYSRKDRSNDIDKLYKTISHMTCQCGATIWQPEFCDGYCSSCNKTNEVSK